MADQQWLAERFEEQRPHLRAVAYRMLGSLSEADDAVQDAWLRVSRADTSEVENLGGWLTTIVGRVALNMLRSRTTRRQQPLDTYLPDPVVDPPEGTDPEHSALLADSVGLALLVVLEALGPTERLAFVLHDMFAVPFEEIATIVDRSPEATRQLAAAPAGGCKAQHRFPTRTSPRSGGLLTPSSRPLGAAIWGRLSPSSTPMSFFERTEAPRACRITSGGRRRSPARRPCGRRWTSPPDEPSSTAPPEWSRNATASRFRSALSRSETGRSSNSTSSSTPTASHSSNSTCCRIDGGQRPCVSQSPTPNQYRR